MPVSVAYDLKALQAGIADIVERLGCKPCFSGAECFFQLERDFLIRGGRRGEESMAMSPMAAGAVSALSASSATAHMSKEVRYDINKVLKSVESIVDKLGHTQCFSGFDFFFRDEVERVILVGRDLKARTIQEVIGG
jgi:hypothetical protein